MKFVINGGKKLNGEIVVNGAKNAAIKMIAASVLFDEKIILENIPDILDIQLMLDILSQNGAEITRNGHTLTIDTKKLTSKDPNPDLVRKMRGSIVLIGPYLARFGKITIPQPGGCAIGSRPLDDHLNGFRQLSTKILKNEDIYYFEREALVGKVINLCPSVTATENMIMAQILADGTTVIKNAAREPQIADLAEFLNQAGAKITGAGTSEITIKGVKKLHSITYKVMSDPFEAATFICMAIATKSDLTIKNCQPDNLYPFLDEIKKIGVKFEIGQNYISIKDAKEFHGNNISSDFYPGFSTDMLPQTALVLTQANGTSNINEKLFEDRLGYLSELVQMGADIKILNKHEAIIKGPTKLKGSNIDSLDLRAGATLIIAGLIAEGRTIIDHAEIIDRGYEKIEERLSKLGADIKRVD